ncbi:BQ5605_C010g05889 [Microbotryum silenes-dioicae]|uniref:BQ5605_C010g05889 protein n=1 Tax=Microbotryum silenes-dioicae TaxID=796604 RepID=A0A2X0LU49_9BASI|nr:BQ5605_C010g05889 [Microbotryum silenes-dioicae]
MTMLVVSAPGFSNRTCPDIPIAMGVLGVIPDGDRDRRSTNGTDDGPDRDRVQQRKQEASTCSSVRDLQGRGLGM